MLTLLSLAATAAAVDATLDVDPFTLADGHVPVVSGSLPDAGAIAADVLYDGVVVNAACQLDVRPDHVARIERAATCPALWTLGFPAEPGTDAGVVGLRVAHDGQTFTATAELAEPRSALPAELAGTTLSFDAGPSEIAVADPEAGWSRVAVQDGAAELTAGQAGLASSPLAFAVQDGELLSLLGPAAAIGEPVPGTDPGTTDAPVDAPIDTEDPTAFADPEAEAWCPDAGEDELVLCWDLTGPSPRMQASDRRQVVKPDTEVVVRVKHYVVSPIGIAQRGSPGVTRRGVRGDEEAVSSRDTEAPTTVTPRDFAPRPPGDASVVLTLGSGETLVYELVVQRTYDGALRTGIAFIGGGALDAEYGAAARDGATTREVIATSRGGTDVELVVGFAPFLDRGGRPANGCVKAPACFAPYVGLGLVAPRASGVDVLTSVHVGAEWEPVSSFSVAATVVTRRVTRLADGVHVGSPVTGEPPVTEGWGVGVGLVLNVTPTFFKVASKGML